MTQVQLPPPQAWTFARLPVLTQRLYLSPRSVLHVGAHHGEEVAIYRQCGLNPIRLVEPDPGNVDILTAKFDADPDIEIIPAAATAARSPERALLYRSERTVHSSLRPGPGQQIEVTTLPVGDLQRNAGIVVLDTQGSELELLAALDLTQPALDLLIVETTRRRGDTAGYYDDVVAHAAGLGWAVAEEWVHDGSGYTDTVLHRTDR